MFGSELVSFLVFKLSHAGWLRKSERRPKPAGVGPLFFWTSRTARDLKITPASATTHQDKDHFCLAGPASSCGRRPSTQFVTCSPVLLCSTPCMDIGPDPDDTQES